MKKFKVTGLLKGQYRGHDLPTVKVEEIKAQDEVHAKHAFEKKHERYDGSSVEEITTDLPGDNSKDQKEDVDATASSKPGKQK